MPNTSTSIFELRVAFRGELACRVKDETLKWLHSRNVAGVVESVIDGVDTALPAEEDVEKLADRDMPDDTPLAVFHESREALDALMTELLHRHPGSISCTIAEIDNVAWEQAWEAGFSQLETRDFVIRREGSSAAAQDPSAAKCLLTLVDGHSFGAGDHATTGAVIESLELMRDETKRDGFLDVGAGNGVLSLVAWKMGFRRIVATEIEDEAILEIRRNASINGCSIDARLTDNVPLNVGTFDVVCANILVPVLHELLPDMAAALAPQGMMFLAGFVEKEAPPLIRTAARCGLTEIGRWNRRGWLCLWMQHRPIND